MDANSKRRRSSLCPPAPPSLTRRGFLRRLAAAAAPALLASCGRSQPRDGVTAPVIDTHMHVWSDDPARFPFAHPYDAGFRPPPVAGTAEMLVEEMREFGLAGAVLVQVIYHGWDNRYLASCLERFPRIFKGQGLIDPTDPDRARQLEHWVRGRGLSGMRFSAIYYPGKDDWLSSRESWPLWEKAEELGAVFNFFIAAPQLPKLEAMVQAFPGVPVAIDHLARIDLKGNDPEGETRLLLGLARHPSVRVKVSELSVISPSGKFPYADTFGTVRRVYDAFGPERLLWGTGVPGATRAQGGRPPLREELALVREEIPFFTASDREKILGGNAAALWGFRAG
ncbi:MAG: amidohydrolase [Planctomycetes bacterium]|nr:amidohydrolase [Planctomycetota bacterium]